jgi:hypothetical protein
MVAAPPPPPDAENPVLKLTGKDLLDFVDAQSKREREYFDRLLTWCKWALVIAFGVAAAVATFLGVQSSEQVQKYVRGLREDAQAQIRIAVDKELTKEKVQEQISRALHCCPNWRAN